MTPRIASQRMTTRRILGATVATSALLGAATLPAIASAPAGEGRAFGHGDAGPRLDYQKNVAVPVLKGAFERRGTAVVDRFVRADYIQHNPVVPDGAEALKNLALAIHQHFPNAEYDIKRVISENDLVVVHSNLVLTPGA